MKIIFPKKDEILVCKKCKTAVDLAGAFSEDGAIDDYWCEVCIDYVDVKIAPITQN